MSFNRNNRNNRYNKGGNSMYDEYGPPLSQEEKKMLRKEKRNGGDENEKEYWRQFIG